LLHFVAIFDSIMPRGSWSKGGYSKIQVCLPEARALVYISQFISSWLYFSLILIDIILSL